MTIPALVAAGRAAHDRLLVDTCVIEHATSGTFDPDTGDYPTTWETVYAGPCRVKGPTAGQAAVDQVQAGEAEQTATRQTLVLPHDTTAQVAVGDRVTVSRVGAATLLFLVVGTVDTTTMTARGFVVEHLDVAAVVAGRFPDDGIIDGGAP